MALIAHMLLTGKTSSSWMNMSFDIVFEDAKTTEEMLEEAGNALLEMSKRTMYLTDDSSAV